MLSLIYGTDQIKRAAARDAFIAIARKKFPNLEVSMRNALDMSREEIEADIYATDLFGAHRMVVIANLSLHEAVESLFPKLLQDVKDRQDLTSDEPRTNQLHIYQPQFLHGSYRAHSA
jgi:DNA polymerase III delta subunit